MPTRIYRDVDTTTEHNRYLDPAIADYPVQSIDIVFGRTTSGVFYGIERVVFDSIEYPYPNERPSR